MIMKLLIILKSRGGWKGPWIRRRIRAMEESVEKEIAKGECFSSFFNK